jgi:ADP-heptose:LPS heptosyltransferase
MKRLAPSALPNALLYWSSTLRRRPSGAFYRKVCIYKPDRLGDAVLALGAIRLLVERHGIENCVLVGSSYTRDVVRLEFPQLELIEVSCGHNRLWRTKSELRQLRSHSLFVQGVESIVSLRHHRTLHDDLLLAAIPAVQTFGVENSRLTDANQQIARSRYRFDNVARIEAVQGECLELGAHRGVISAHLGSAISAQKILPTLDKPSGPASAILGISPFGSSTMRDLSMLHIGSVCEWGAARGFELRVWAEPGRRDRYDKLVQSVHQQTGRTPTVVVTPSVSELLREMLAARVIVATETFTAHLATALDKPFVGFLGGGHYGQFAPWFRSARQRWISHKIECFGCNWNCHQPEPFCLSRIGESQIQSALTAVTTVNERAVFERP